MNKFPQNINFLLFLISLFLLLIVSCKPSVWAGFGDPYDYLYQSKIAITNLEFFAPHKIPSFYPRPFTVPLFYKLAGSEPDAIVQMQKLVHVLSAFYIISAIMLFFKKNSTKLFIILCIYTLMMWWNIAGWTIVLLSESLSISLLFCWIASFLILYKKRNWFYFIIHIFITILFSFTRDTWPYILILFYLIFSIFAFLWEKQLLKKSIILICFAFILFFVQQKSATVGNRYKLPLINTIVLRIIPNQQYTEWFISHGMPCTQKLKQNFVGINPADYSREKIYNLYNDTSYNEFFNWVVNDGKSVYMKFLITHPKYSLLFEESQQQLKRIFIYNLIYPDNERGFSTNIGFLFPLFNPLVVFILSLLLIYIFIKKKNIILLMPIYLIVIFVFNVILTYNADTLEVERHLFITNIMVQFIGFLCIAILLENIDILKQIWNQIKTIRISRVKKT